MVKEFVDSFIHASPRARERKLNRDILSLFYYIPFLIMPQYELSQTYYFRETGKKYEAGETVELTEEQAAEHNQNNPGLLKPLRRTTQGAPNIVHSTTPVARKKRAPRAKA